MGWNAVLAADVELPPDRVETWRALAIDDARFRSWGPLTARTPPGVGGTVLTQLSSLERFGRACEEAGTGEFLELRWEGSRFSVRGYVNEDDYRAIGRQLATVVRIAEKVGGRGQLLVLADDGADGERTILDGGESRYEAIAMHDVFGGGAAGPLEVDYASVVNELFERRASAPLETPEKKAAPKKTAPKTTTPKKANVAAKAAGPKRAKT